MGNKKVLVADAISRRGVEALEAGGDLIVDVRTGLKEPELLEIISEYAGLVVRSQTKVTAKVIEAARALKAVGRVKTSVRIVGPSPHQPNKNSDKDQRAKHGRLCN